MNGKYNRNKRTNRNFVINISKRGKKKRACKREYINYN